MKRPNFRGISGNPDIKNDLPGLDENLAARLPDYERKRSGQVPTVAQKTPVITMWNFAGTQVNIYDFTDNKVGDRICTISAKTYRQFRDKHPKGPVFRIVNEFGVGELTV